MSTTIYSHSLNSRVVRSCQNLNRPTDLIDPMLLQTINPYFICCIEHEFKRWEYGFTIPKQPMPAMDIHCKVIMEKGYGAMEEDKKAVFQDISILERHSWSSICGGIQFITRRNCYEPLILIWMQTYHIWHM